MNYIKNFNTNKTFPFDFRDLNRSNVTIHKQKSKAN